MAKSPSSQANFTRNNFEIEGLLLPELKKRISVYNFSSLFDYVQNHHIPDNSIEVVCDELYDLAQSDLDLEKLLKIAPNSLAQIINISLNNMNCGGHKINRTEFQK